MRNRQESTCQNVVRASANRETLVNRRFISKEERKKGALVEYRIKHYMLRIETNINFNEFLPSTLNNFSRVANRIVRFFVVLLRESKERILNEVFSFSKLKK